MSNLIKRGNLFNVRKQISDYIKSILDRIGGPSDWVGYTAFNMRWRDHWLSGVTFYRGDVVVDRGWTMIANTDTTERAAPQPFGDPSWLLPDIFAWENRTHTGSIYSGVRLTVPDGELYEIDAVRVWLPVVTASERYRLITHDLNTDVVYYGPAFDGTVLTAQGWYDVPFSRHLVPGGDQISFVLQTWNTSNNTVFTHPWVFSGASQNTHPLPGDWNRDNQQTVIRFNSFDDDGIDRSVELQSVLINSIIVCEEEGVPDNFNRYIVNGTFQVAGGMQFNVTLQSTGGQGVPSGNRSNVTFTVPTPAQAEYVDIVGQWASAPNVSGYLSFDSYEGGSVTTDAYGVDIQYLQYSMSNDWDIVAVSNY